ncbi:MAG: HupE/UreJ family protein [Rhodospirillaceae bacterium]|nr:HupE/UreJ family protein [Rhodospirillaceae bacterium]
MSRLSLLLAAGLALIAVPAWAHTGAGPTSGLLAGLGHPLGGLDHVLAMVAIGILAAQQGGRSLWLIPLAFLAMLAVGGAMGAYGVPLPLVETGIVGSVIVLGMVVAVGRHMSLAASMALAGVFAVFHGHAHGTEMPVPSGLDYAAGFMLATAALHAAGAGLGIGVRRLAATAAPYAVRLMGGAIAVGGVMLATA